MSGTPARVVTEADFRKPEFRDAKVEDYEFSGDGTLVRKDRWEQAVRTICDTVGLSTRRFEIDAVVQKVEEFAQYGANWEPFDPQELAANPLPLSSRCAIKLEDGSVLMNATLNKSQEWVWQGRPVPAPVVAWKEL